MGALWLILKVLGVLLLLLLGAAFLLLTLPAWVYLRWDHGELGARARILCFSIPLYPRGKKKQKGERQKKKSVQGQEKKEKDSRAAEKKFQIAAAEIFDLVSEAKGIFEKLLSTLRVEQVELRFPVHGQDAAATALLYGRVNAFFYSGVALLQNAVRLQVKNIEIIPDFGEQYRGDIVFACRVGMAPIVLLVCVYQVYARLKRAGLL